MTVVSFGIRTSFRPFERRSNGRSFQLFFTEAPRLPPLCCLLGYSTYIAKSTPVIGETVELIQVKCEDSITFFSIMNLLHVSVSGLGGLKEAKMLLPHPRVKVSIVGSLRDREVACSASDRQGSIFESCVWRTVSSQSSHHPQEVLLAQFSLYVHKGGLKPDSFHLIYFM